MPNSPEETRIGRRIELPVPALRGAGDLARRAGTHAGAWPLKRPGTPRWSAEQFRRARRSPLQIPPPPLNALRGTPLSPTLYWGLRSKVYAHG
jgi:hypothetical protein